MAKDAWLLGQLVFQARPLLHFYRWERPCLTYGTFMDPSLYLHVDGVEEKGLHMARRPTGGGIIFHLTDLAFSLLIPSHYPGFSFNTLENYRWVNERVREIIGRLMGKQIDLLSIGSGSLSKESRMFCMASPVQYDLMVEGKKVGGAAQRRKKHGFLHQATLSLSPPPYALLGRLLKYPEGVLTDMRQQGGFLLSSSSTEKDRKEAEKEIQEALKKDLLF